eukprot:GFUD01128638.1.p1 GENE.GFUD01128638.1~~GFUD01128638.1.p1  ORF type:complete len:104 (+),score=29.13 GFUD01128638.1:126-437(+)
MASSFELGDEQPQVCRQRTTKLAANSYQNLFGAPADRSRPRVRRIDRSKRDPPVRRSTKPLPVNTLTGAIIGLSYNNVAQTMSVSQPQYYARRSLRGSHSQLW